MDYKKANGVNLGFLVFVIVFMIVVDDAAAADAADAAVAKGFCNSGDFVIANVIPNLP